MMPGLRIRTAGISSGGQQTVFPASHASSLAIDPGLREPGRRTPEGGGPAGGPFHSQGIEHRFLGVTWKFSCFRARPVLG